MGHWHNKWADPNLASGASLAQKSGQRPDWDLAIYCAVHADPSSCVSVLCDMILGRLHIMPDTQAMMMMRYIICMGRLHEIPYRCSDNDETYHWQASHRPYTRYDDTNNYDHNKTER